MRRSSSRRATLSVAIALLAATSWANTAPASPAATTPPATSWSAATAGAEFHDGFIPYFWDAAGGRLLFSVHVGGPAFLYASGVSAGVGTIDPIIDRGSLGSMGLCHLERSGPRVLMVREQTAQRALAGGAAQRVVDESFPVSIVAAWPVLADSASVTLVDASELLHTDTQVTPALRDAHAGDWKPDAARTIFRPARSGAFPRNTELDATLTFTCDTPSPEMGAVLPDGHTMSVSVHHTFLQRPGPGFTSRESDPRIGYFPELFQDHTARLGSPIQHALAQRWRLLKKDPAAAVSEPVEPLVYYLDRGIPEPERSTIRRAALWWNHAFAVAGFRDAFVVRDLPEGATFLDARYSGIQWVNRVDRSWSFGQVQSDPETGEIVHAVAVLDSHRRRTTWKFWSLTTGDAPRRGAACAAGDAMLDDAFGALGDSLAMKRLAYLAAHEVGHTLGLGHNWAATTFGWGSVMDYLPPHIELDANGGFDLRNAYPGDIGSYDTLAIAWGYTPDAPSTQLDAMVRAALAHGVVLPVDSDPRWAEYDWGADPVAWLRTTAAVRTAILARFGSSQLRENAPVYELQERFAFAYLYHRFAVQAVQQTIGGQYATNALKGDGQTPVAWVPAKAQRAGLHALCDMLAPAQLAIPQNIVRELAPAPLDRPAVREQLASEAGNTFSVLTAARVAARLIAAPLLEPARLARCELSGAPDARDVEHALVNATWGMHEPGIRAPADARAAAQAALARVAQREVLDELLMLARRDDASPEVRATTYAELAALRRQLRALPLTTVTAHRALALRDLDNVLAASPVPSPALKISPAPPGRPIGGAPQ